MHGEFRASDRHGLASFQNLRQALQWITTNKLGSIGIDRVASKTGFGEIDEYIQIT